MSETPTRFALEAADDLLLYPGRATLATIDKHLAAAEERGRRKGVEERDELRDRMHQTIAFLLSCVASGEKLSDEEEAGIRAMLREGLAPRDSARCPDGDPFCACQKPMDAPRDSGKEKT